MPGLAGTNIMYVCKNFMSNKKSIKFHSPKKLGMYLQLNNLTQAAHGCIVLISYIIYCKL